MSKKPVNMVMTPTMRPLAIPPRVMAATISKYDRGEVRISAMFPIYFDINNEEDVFIYDELMTPIIISPGKMYCK